MNYLTVDLKFLRELNYFTISFIISILLFTENYNTLYILTFVVNLISLKYHFRLIDLRNILAFNLGIFLSEIMNNDYIFNIPIKETDDKIYFFIICLFLISLLTILSNLFYNFIDFLLKKSNINIS